jgi:hypothetical protein
MAFRTLRTSVSGATRTFFNIDYAVGSTGWNNKVDVKLVQSLLRLFYYDLMGFNGGMDPPADSTEPITVDGIVGRDTRKHIMRFQQQQHSSGTATLLDGRFDPFRAHKELSHIAHVEYALGNLNILCNNACRTEGLDLFDRFTEQPYVAEHADLVTALNGPLRNVARQYGNG